MLLFCTLYVILQADDDVGSFGMVVKGDGPVQKPPEEPALRNTYLLLLVLFCIVSTMVQATNDPPAEAEAEDNSPAGHPATIWRQQPISDADLDSAQPSSGIPATIWRQDPISENDMKDVDDLDYKGE
ncbi:hypothetical protein LSTR_LSTR006616 [Laodelphax striatellus]|uniref:Uncharacterized protein n=1 Tax=Laodelphax striatellus TaxID=195883 RepID=A0A482WZW6_LAOST|nr:hypothetical protein LSTR_LSTR006616 [Laodelphax striatellus]